MLNKIIITLIFTSLLFISCKKDTKLNSGKKETKIHFRFNGYIKDTLKIPNIRFTEYRPVVSYVTEASPYVDKILVNDSNAKTDTITITSKSQIVLKHKYRLDDIYFIFEPGDSIEYNDKDGFPIYRVLNREATNFIDLDYELKKRAYLHQYNPKDFTYFQISELMSATNQDEVLKHFIDKVHSDFDLESKFIDSLYLAKKISQPFYSLQKQKMKFDKYNLMLSVKGKDFYRENEELLRKEFNNDTLIKYDFFKKFLKKTSYFESLYREKDNKTAPSDLSTYEFVIGTDLLLSKSKDYLLYYYLQQIAENLSQNDFEKAFKDFTINVKSNFLKADIENKYLINFKELKKNIEKVNFVNLKKYKNTLDSVIGKNKNKLIYIDFWASWCAPCRAAMPASKKLQQDYQDKDVVFMYVSIDKDFEKWENASKSEGLLLSNNNFLAINYPNANFYKELKLSTIPRYILYDKNGKLVHQKAPAPDTKQIRELFEKYLN